ncbi:right-handed parallel beta-helix repeat-containing protein [Aquirhabdus parva]|uniref:Pectate lyase superfamily protein domain-containing protein n=1 Tax=Aquirhabdus parva TaxID=2283318 RepID=A0A345P972_9GAMM|nr:hypothetical protein [Aquirhabdus parva]AXI03831.1 hypothetical protein HYN46_13905 [Aquirhabdus parva]
MATSVFDYMSAAQIADVQAGSASIDVSTAINTAIGANTGDLSFPPGIYLLNSTINVNKSNLNLIGSGKGATTLTSGNATQDIITVSALSNNNVIRSLSITSKVAKTGGAAISVSNCHDVRISDIRIDNVYNGIVFDGGAQQYLYFLDNFEINGGYIGVLVGPSTNVQDLWIDSGSIANTTNDGVLLLRVTGIYMSKVDIMGAQKHGLEMYPPTGFYVSGFFTNVLCDTCANHGWAIGTNGGTTAEVLMTDCWGSSCGNGTTQYHGLYVDEGVSGGRVSVVKINGGSFMNNWNNGIKLQKGDAVTLSGTQVLCNNVSQTASVGGLQVSNAFGNVNITGGFYANAGLEFTNRQNYGISIDSGYSGLCSILGSHVTPNLIGGMNLPSSLPSGLKVITCAGFNTVNKGSGKLSAGSSFVIVNHNLNVTPKIEELSIDISGNPTAAGLGNIWIDPSTLNATSFKVIANTVASGDLYFNWQAHTLGA